MVQFNGFPMQINKDISSPIMFLQKFPIILLKPKNNSSDNCSIKLYLKPNHLI